MDDKTLERRMKLLHRLMHEKRNAIYAYEQYTTQNRQYQPGANLYMREAHFVMAVEPGNGKTMTELSELLQVTMGAVSQTAARLEKKGFIVRQRSESDKRCIVARLTPEGEKLYVSHAAYDRKYYMIMLSHLDGYSDEQLAALADYEQLMAKLFTMALEESSETQ